MPVRNLKPITPDIWIPTTANSVGKIEIIGDDNTVYTVYDSAGGGTTTNFTIDARFTRSVTDRMGDFVIKLSNDNGRFLDVFNGGEIIRMFIDTVDATTLQFYGKIDNVKYGVNLSDGFFVELDGREYPEMIDKTISGLFAGTLPDVALAQLLYDNYSDVTLVYWNGTSWVEATYNPGSETVTWSDTEAFPTTTINLSYQHRKGWSVITEICERAGLDCYMEYDYAQSKWTLRTFNKEAIENTDSAVSYGTNLINLSEFGNDNTETYNRVVVYGKIESDNILLMRTKENTASQSNLWIKDKIIQDASLTSMEDVEDKAVYELESGVSSIISGRLQSVILYPIRPGQMLNISVPLCGISGYYKIQSYTHTLNQPFTTDLEVSRKIATIKDLFVPKLNAEEVLDVQNPNNMKDSYTIYFDEATSKLASSSTNITTINGILSLGASGTSGYAISSTYNTDYNVSQCELRRYESFDVLTDQYEVSNTGGATWETYSTTAGYIHNFSLADSRLKWRIRLRKNLTTDPSPSYESICLLYK